MLEKLCEINCTSGDEKLIRDFIINEISDYCEYSIDALGSIIAFKKGKIKPEKRVMICAHMDEVGFIITGITDDGYLEFSPVGGINPNVAINRVITVNGINGVTGLKPIHLQSAEEKKSIPKFSELKIDIGARDKADAEKYVSIGDYGYFKSDYCELGNGYIKSKALDDRIGCMLLIELIKSDLKYDAYFCFNVQEEVGLRGAECTAYTVKPDTAIILEATTAADLCGVKGSKRVCVLGGGPVISFMDGRTVYDSSLYKLAFKTAENNNITAQAKTAVAGGNDAGAVQTAAGGAKVLAISLPCRYIHSAASVVKKSDIEETRKLLFSLLPKLYD